MPQLDLGCHSKGRTCRFQGLGCRVAWAARVGGYAAASR